MSTVVDNQRQGVVEEQQSTLEVQAHSMAQQGEDAVATASNVTPCDDSSSNVETTGGFETPPRSQGGQRLTSAAVIPRASNAICSSAPSTQNGSAGVLAAIKDNNINELKYQLKIHRNLRELILTETQILQLLLEQSTTDLLKVILRFLKVDDKKQLLTEIKVDGVFNALHFSIIRGKSFIVSAILNLTLPDTINCKTTDGDNILHSAVYFEQVPMLLNEGNLKKNHIDYLVNDSNNNREQPLHIAAKNGHVAYVKLLYQNGAPLETKDIEGCTPFLCAVFEKENATIHTLATLGANVNTTDNNGRCVVDIFGVNNIPAYLLQVLFENGLILTPHLLPNISFDDFYTILDSCITYIPASKMFQFKSPFSHHTLPGLQNIISIHNSDIGNVEEVMDHATLTIFTELQFTVMRYRACYHLLQFETHLTSKQKAEVTLPLEETYYATNPDEPRVFEAMICAVTGACVSTAPGNLANPLYFAQDVIEKMRDVVIRRGENCTRKYVKFAALDAE